MRSASTRLYVCVCLLVLPAHRAICDICVCACVHVRACVSVCLSVCVMCVSSVLSGSFNNCIITNYICLGDAEDRRLRSQEEVGWILRLSSFVSGLNPKSLGSFRSRFRV